jgi:hypothetical protein
MADQGVRRKSNNEIEERLAALEAFNSTAKPGFSAWLTGNVAVNNDKVVWDATQWNYGNGFNTSTGQFTAPKKGRYLFIVRLTSNGVQSFNFGFLSVGGAGARTRDMFEANTASFSTNGERVSSTILELEQGDIVDFRINGTFTPEGTNENFYSLFQGQLLDEGE